MGVNKSKLRRERKKAAQPQPPAPSQPARRNSGWKIRLAAMIPPVLYACYLVWDLSKQ